MSLYYSSLNENVFVRLRVARKVCHYKDASPNQTKKKYKIKTQVKIQHSTSDWMDMHNVNLTNQKIEKYNKRLEALDKMSVFTVKYRICAS